MKKRQYSTLPGFRSEPLTPDTLRTIASVMEKHRVTNMRFGTGGRIAVKTTDPDIVDAIGTELKRLSSTKPPNGITYIHYCPGIDQCQYGMRDGQSVAARIAALPLSIPAGTKIKVGIAACPMCCTEPFVRDIGLLSSRNGWKVLFGGNAGARPRIADVIAEDLSDTQAVELVRRCLELYLQRKTKKMRTARYMEHVGAEQVRAVVLQPPL